LKNEEDSRTRIQLPRLLLLAFTKRLVALDGGRHRCQLTCELLLLNRQDVMLLACFHRVVPSALGRFFGLFLVFLQPIMLMLTLRK